MGQAPATPPAPPEPRPSAPLYQAKGEQYRIYNFPGTGESIPYRLFVPSRWTTGTRLPMLVTLRAGNTVDGPYRAQNDLVRVAEQRGYIVVTPMGYRGLSQPYYGSPYKIARPSAADAGGRVDGVRKTTAPSRTSSTSWISSRRNTTWTRRGVYLHGQNPSGSGALYLASKYTDRFAAVVVSSAPDRVRRVSVRSSQGQARADGDPRRSGHRQSD